MTREMGMFCNQFKNGALWRYNVAVCRILHHRSQSLTATADRSHITLVTRPSPDGWCESPPPSDADETHHTVFAWGMTICGDRGWFAWRQCCDHFKSALTSSRHFQSGGVVLILRQAQWAALLIIRTSAHNFETMSQGIRFNQREYNNELPLPGPEQFFTVRNIIHH